MQVHRDGLRPQHFTEPGLAQTAVTLLEQERQEKADRDPQFVPFCPNKNELLAQYFDIDLKKVEQEREELLRALREAHQ
jgi:hypothetical protein